MCEISAENTFGIPDPKNHGNSSKRRGPRANEELDEESRDAVKSAKVDVLLKEDDARLAATTSPQLLCSPEKSGRVAEVDVPCVSGGFKMAKKSQTVAGRVPKKVLASTGEESWMKCCSPATGLICLSVSSSSSTAISLASRQSLKVYFGPSLVIVNTVGGGERLELGLILEKEKVLEDVLESANLQLGPELIVRATLTSARDPFAWVAGLSSIPKVGGSGLYQLSVQRPPQHHRGEMSMRKELEEVTRQLEGVVRVSHGEGESLVLVGHMVHALVFTNHISRTFHTQLQHVWPPSKQPKDKADLLKGERWLIVMLKEENKEGGALHRQLYVHRQLSSLGRVVHLEQAAFGASYTFLAMVEQSKGLCGLADTMLLLEVDPTCLPTCTFSRYILGSLGFYVVDGRFPSPCAAGLKDKFAKEMQVHGAVGFQKGESERSFSLQFVNPGGLEKALRSTMAEAFSLVIKSGVRKVEMETVSARDDEPWKLVGPSCEDICKGGEEINRSKDERAESGKGKMDSKKKDVKEKKAKDGAGAGLKGENKIQREGKNKKGRQSQQEYSAFQSTDIRERKKSEEKEIPADVLSGSGNNGTEDPDDEAPSCQEIEVTSAQCGEDNPLTQVAPGERELANENKKDVEVGHEDEQDGASFESCDSVVTLSEDQLLSIRWKKAGNLTIYLQNLATFLGKFPGLKVEEKEDVTLVFPSKLQVFFFQSKLFKSNVLNFTVGKHTFVHGSEGYQLSAETTTRR